MLNKEEIFQNIKRLKENIFKFIFSRSGIYTCTYICSYRNEKCIKIYFYFQRERERWKKEKIAYKKYVAIYIY